MPTSFPRSVLLAAVAAGAPVVGRAAIPATRPTTAPEATLSFQTGAAWHPRLNVDADVAMVYGVTPTTAERMKSWRDHGYAINLMTGVAWGEYQDYLFGRFDGKRPPRRGTDHQERQPPRPRQGRLLHVPGPHLRGLPVHPGQACDRRRGPGPLPGGAGVLDGRRVRAPLQARVGAVLPRAVAGPRLVGRRPLPQFPAEVLPVPPGPGRRVPVRPVVRQADRPRRQVLRGHPQPDQLRRLGHRQPRVVAAGRGLRRVHRPGLDRDGPEPERARRRQGRADVRDRLPRVRPDAEPGPRQRPRHVVPQRPGRGQPPPHLGRLPVELGTAR